MSKNCNTCKYEEVDCFDEPCYYCVDKKFYKPKTERDYRAIHFELLGMYVSALGDCEGIDDLYYQTQKDKFMDLLSEYYTAIRFDIEKEN